MSMWIHMQHVYAHTLRAWECLLQCCWMSIKGHYILNLMNSFRLFAGCSGKVLQQHFLGKVKIFCVFIRALGTEYFTLNSTSDTQNYDLFITRWSRCCGWEAFASPLLLIDMYRQTARSLLLQLSVGLWSHCHWYASSLTLTDHGASFMNPPWCRVWLMLR